MSERVGIKKLIEHVRTKRGQGYSLRKVHALVATEGLPAFLDPDHLTTAGTPALLFDLAEFDQWFEARLRRVNPAPLPNVAPLRPSTPKPASARGLRTAAR